MVEGKRVAVVVPAFEEEHLVAETLRGIPDFVDRIYVVDDASPDETAARARAVADPRVEVIVHEQNGGVGAAIVTGYLRAREERIDVTCVMAADNQMDPDELASLVGPVARGEVDYTKANRLITGEAWTLIPHSRYLGNAVLSLLTKIASGYWHVADSQAGYTALSLAALDRLDLERIYRRYGFPNDMLVHLNVVSASVRDVPSRPIYGVGERSGISIHYVAPRIAWLLFKGFWWRMKEKYVIRDFHPLVFFYVLGTLMTVLGLAARPRRRLLAHLLRQRDHDRDDRPRGAAPDLGHAVHPVRDVVRPGVEQGAPLTGERDSGDPFRLLEVESAETLAWQSRQNEAADAILRDWDGFDELRAAVAPHLARVSVTAPVRRGAHWFRVDSGPLVVADTPTGPGRTLVDPGDASLDWFFPSPQGTRVAYGLSFGGDEQSVLHVIETDERRGAPRPDPVHLERHRRLVPRRVRVRRQRGDCARLRAGRQGAARPSARPGRGLAARADRGARAVLRLPAGLGRRTLARCDHERGRASRRLDSRAAGRRLAAVPARGGRNVQRRLRRRRATSPSAPRRRRGEGSSGSRSRRRPTGRRGTS